MGKCIHAFISQKYRLFAFIWHTIWYAPLNLLELMGPVTWKWLPVKSSDNSIPEYLTYSIGQLVALYVRKTYSSTLKMHAQSLYNIPKAVPRKHTLEMAVLAATV